MSADKAGVQVWQDGARVARIKGSGLNCLAVSPDGRWIAAGSRFGNVFVWNAKTYEQLGVFQHNRGLLGSDIYGVDFSLDSSRMVTASEDQTAAVWEVATRKQVFQLDHRHLNPRDWDEDYGPVTFEVRAAKYSPQGDRIATATFCSVQVWDSNNGRLLVHIQVRVEPFYNTGLLWCDDHLFIVSMCTIKKFDASTGSAVSEWSIKDETTGWYNHDVCIALPKHGEFIACSVASSRTVTVWDTSTHTQLSHARHTQNICSIAISPDDRFLAMGGENGTVAVQQLSRITVSIVSR